MARKPVPRSLPGLREMHPEFRGFAPQQHLSAAIAGMLRDIIDRVRTPHSTAFYSVRETAAFFGVSPRTMATIYGRLEAEGLLTRVRSSRTVLPGRKLQARHPVRGVVGMAIAFPAFMYGSNPRDLYVRLEEELRRHRFVADFIFYQMEEELRRPAELAERLLEHQLDVVLWFAPAKTAVPAMQRLLDAGVQLVTINDGKAHYPREQYLLDLEAGFADGIGEWQRDGIKRVAVFAPGDGSMHREAESLARVLERHRMRHEIWEVSDAETGRKLRRLAGKRGWGVLLQPHHWYESLCDQFPQVMDRLFRSNRVLLGQGAVAHGYFHNKNIFADVVTQPYEEMAQRIAQDIVAGKIATTEHLATFHSVWQPRVNLGKVDRVT